MSGPRSQQIRVRLFHPCFFLLHQLPIFDKYICFSISRVFFTWQNDIFFFHRCIGRLISFLTPALFLPSKTYSETNPQLLFLLFYYLSWGGRYWMAKGSWLFSTYLVSSSPSLPRSSTNRSLSSSSLSQASSSRSPSRIPIPTSSIASKPGQIPSPKASHFR